MKKTAAYAIIFHGDTIIMDSHAELNLFCYNKFLYVLLEKASSVIRLSEKIHAYN